MTALATIVRAVLPPPECCPHPPLLAPIVPSHCKWCEQQVGADRMAAHTMDRGAATDCPPDACEVLFELRKGVAL